MASEKRPGGQRATLQHLQALQSGRPLEPLLGSLAAGGQPQRPEQLFAKAGAAGEHKAADLAATIRTAEFWISLLEGEHSELVEEAKKHKQRLQDSRRVAEAKASALRESDGEKRRLEAELKWLRESRDKAICERSIAKDSNQRIEKNSKLDRDELVAKADSLEEVLEREKEDKWRLEHNLVQTKVRYANVLQQKDSMECLISYYEDQLKALVPSFEKVDLNTAAAWLRPIRSPDVVSCRDSELQSNASSQDLDTARSRTTNFGLTPPLEAQSTESQPGKSRGLMKLAKIRTMFNKSLTGEKDKEAHRQSSSSRPAKGAPAVEQPPACGPGQSVTPRSSRGEPRTPTLRSMRSMDEHAPVTSSSAAAVSRESSAAASERPRRPKRWEMRQE